MSINLSELPVDNELSCCALFGPSPGKQDHAVKVSGNERNSSFRVARSGPFSHILSDQNGLFWVVQWTERSSDPTDIHVYNHSGELIETLTVEGRPDLYEYGDSVFAGCESDDGFSRIYQFSKPELKLRKKWKVNGFVWGLYLNRDVLYATCYLPGDNLAVLYVLGEQEEAAIELGENFFPTDLFFLNKVLFVSACPVLGREKSRIIQLDDSFSIIKEFQVNTPPRRIYANETELVVFGRELVRAKNEKLVYCNLETGKRKEFSLPPIHKVQSKDDHLYLLNLEEKAILKWDYRKRKLTKKYPIPEIEDRPLLDFHCHG